MSGSSSTTRMWALVILRVSVRAEPEAPISSPKAPGRCGCAEAVGKAHLLGILEVILPPACNGDVTRLDGSCYDPARGGRGGGEAGDHPSHGAMTCGSRVRERPAR